MLKFNLFSIIPGIPGISEIRPIHSRDNYNKQLYPTMRFKSTRGRSGTLSFEEVVLGGLASDGGLYVPESIPKFLTSDIENVRSLFALSQIMLY
jgi:hypothetical protein